MIAVGTVSVGCFLLFIVWELSAVNASYIRGADHAALEYAESAEARIGRTCTDREILAFTKCVREEVKTEQESQTAQYDLAEQRRMALWALCSLIVSSVSLIITIIGIYFVWKSLGAAYDAIESERETGEAQVRAYVTVAIFGIYLDRSKLVVRLKLVNSGNSPAFLGSIKCCFGESYLNPNVLPNYNLPSRQLFGTLRQGSETNEIILTSARMISKQEEANLGATLVVNIETEIDYVDVFDKRQPLVVSHTAFVVRYPKEEIRFYESSSRKGYMATYLPEALQG